MDNQFDFPPPIEFLPCLTWEQIISKENHWANPRITSNNGDNSPCFKTRMCRGFKIRRCTNGDSCKFAHSSEEIRRPPRVWFPREEEGNSGSNPNRYGRFKQSEEQKLHKTKLYSQHSENWKRKCCPHWSTSRRCPFHPKCNYAHGDEELKELRVDSWEAGGKRVAPAPLKVSLRLSEKAPPKINQQPGFSLPRATDLTLAKCKRIYGDWID
ncbi:Zinc finger CCCH domain-containing protein 12 [Platanthera guangdongensis]|uniref:Zinc finger CCCH domain-containing protein 12 n=1 Tax=Platanthera guangdongensis TaxID=2320717 RepID=A0ABR2LGY7_9ASPA